MRAGAAQMSSSMSSAAGPRRPAGASGSRVGAVAPCHPMGHGHSGPIVNMCMLALLQRSCTKCIDRYL